MDHQFALILTGILSSKTFDAISVLFFDKSRQSIDENIKCSTTSIKCPVKNKTEICKTTFKNQTQLRQNL